MDFNYHIDSKRTDTINPADLHAGVFNSAGNYPYDPYADTSIFPLNNLTSPDSAVDLTSLPEWKTQVKPEHTEYAMDQFLELGPSSQPSETPSPSHDMLFSQANSPDLFQPLSKTSSPETASDVNQDMKASPPDDKFTSFCGSPDSIPIPRTVETPQIHIFPDKTKTRAETQIKVQLVLDPLDEVFDNIRFQRNMLAKPKLLASSDEIKEIESRSEALHMYMFLVCATAVEDPERLEQALRRARGEEAVPRREPGVQLAEMEKDDPAHPQNGGQVVICEGCKERERKRYDRKKKRAEDEEEWWGYEDDRIIMINEKEYKKWKDVESCDRQFSSRAKQVEFAMRIACYCRHQEEKSPVGYRVIFTFKTASGQVVAQHTSEIFQITDDHKNKEVAPEGLPRPLTIPQQPYVQAQYSHTPNGLPGYQYPTEGQFTQPTPMSAYSQPPTPIMTNFQTPMSPMENAFPQPTAIALPSRPGPLNFSNVSTPGSQFSMAQAHGAYDVPMLSPVGQVSPGTTYLHRPVSMDNFTNFNFTSPIQYPDFTSAPPSTVSTPINLSRPASPSWDQGPSRKVLRCVYVWEDTGFDNQ